MQEADNPYLLELYATSLSIAKASPWMWDIENNKFFFPDNFGSILGYTDGELTVGFDSWSSLIHDDDKAKVLEYIDTMLRDRIPTTIEIEYRMRCKDGGYKWIKDRFKLFLNANHQASKIVGVVYDISNDKKLEDNLKNFNLELKARMNAEIAKRTSSERKFEQIFNSGVDAFLLAPIRDENQIDYICDTNSMAYSLSGYNKGELEFLKPNMLFEDFDTLVEDFFKLGEIKESQSILTTKDNRKIAVSLNLTMTEVGSSRYLLIEAKDISEQKRIEAENAQQMKVMMHQSKLALMGEMISAIAHQWRQPLNALGITVQDMKGAWKYGEVNEKYIEDTVCESMKYINQMSKTIDDFRSFFKAGKEKSNFCPRDEIAKVLEILSAQLSTDEITVNIGERLEECSIFGYPDEFRQVIINLINNAKDALVETRKSDRVIDISFDSIDGKKVISVSDNAGGIDDSIIFRIFEPYFTTKEQGKGTGIGLYMSKNIIEHSMHGKIEASNSAQGAVFKIIL